MNIPVPKNYPRLCKVCNVKAKDMSDLTMGQISPDKRSWYCFEHTEVLWENCARKSGRQVSDQSTYWDYLESVNGNSARPR